MGTVISNLKARFGVDTSDFKKGLKDGEGAVSDFKGAAGDSLEQFASMFGVNMSAVNDSIGTASKALNFLKSGFMAAAKGGDVLTISAKILKVALVSTGLGAIVVVLGSIAAYFMKSGAGADKFAKILAQVKSVVNNVIDRLAVFGKGLWEIMTGKFRQGWETMTGAFKGMGDEIKEDWKAAGQLADAEDALEDKEIALITSLSARKAKVAELRQQAKEEMDDQKKKLELLNEAEKLVKSVYSDQVSLEKERLRIMKEKLAIQSSDPTDDQLREIAEQQLKVNELYKEQAQELKALAREKNTVIEANEKEMKQFRSFSNIKMPELTNQKWAENIQRSMKQLQHTIIQVKEGSVGLFEMLGVVGVDAANALNGAFEELAGGFGQLLGNMIIGKEGFKGFAVLVGGVFADMAISVGKTAIATGLAVLGIKQALLTLNPWAAIGAGIALVALGSAVKGSLSAAASGGTGSSAVAGSGGSSFNYDARMTAQEIKLNITGKLTAEGPDLVHVFNYEATRRKNST
jgi:hypothetical protein